MLATLITFLYRPFAALLSLVVFVLVWLYRIFLSPFLGHQCRYYPTCSRYALDALRRYPYRPHYTLYLITLRLLRCHPFSRHNHYDPVP